MKAHIVFAHPNLKSYNGQLRNVAIQTLQGLGWSVTCSDLYQMKFKASADEDDFTSLYDADFFDLQKEQQAALQRRTFAEDITKEHQLLEEADLLIFQFPLWWHNVPGLLKGYIDRVFSMGWAYGNGQALMGKKVLVSMTTGAPEFVWTPEKRGTIKETFKHLFIGTFGLMQMQNLEPFVVYGAKKHAEVDRKSELERFRARLKEIVG
ncbi:MAG: NAD(P)H-dependent oxidoreductase [Bacteroidota bacterium]